MRGLNTDTAARDRIYEYEKHREFWQNGLQLIEEVSASLESSLALLEKKYADFDSIYEEAMDRIDELAAIYSGINTIQGREYVLRLKALMREYRNRYSIEGINFNALYYLQARIRNCAIKASSISRGYSILRPNGRPLPVPANRSCRSSIAGLPLSGTVPVLSCRSKGSKLSIITGRI